MDTEKINAGVGEEDPIEIEDSFFEETENEEEILRMDYTIETPEGRNERVKEIIATTPPEKLTPKYLEKLSE